MNSTPHYPWAGTRPSPTRAFTILELLVAVSILTIILIILVAMVNGVSTVWRSTTGKISAFDSARSGFEAMTRKVSQATLNTYWDYQYPGNDPTKPPSAYVRQSELHMVAGQAADLVPGSVATTSHAIFFQAPLGYSSSPGQSKDLQNLLNSAGYFIQHSDDAMDRPKFLDQGGTALVPKRTRYRLMEVWHPSENLRVFQPSLSELQNNPEKRREWFTLPLAENPSPARPIAENILVLVIWPRRAVTDPGPPFSEGYAYDTRAYLDNPEEDPKSGSLASLSRNQLPPVIQLTMVAIDEPSAARLESLPVSEKSLLQPGALFTSLGAGTDLAEQEKYYQADLARLTNEFLNKHRLNYRVFTSAVTLRQAKWSEE